MKRYDIGMLIGPSIIFFTLPLLSVYAQAPLPSGATESALVQSSAPAAAPIFAAPNPEPPVRGIHVTGWAAGSSKARKRFIADMKAAQLNAVAVAVKEYDGIMFVKDVPLAKQIGAYANAIPDLAGCARDFKEAGIYTIARITVFKDDLLARKRPDLAVHRPDGGLWKNDNGVAWVDPYRREVWDYNLDIASRAAAAGFDEIQLDYIRFPSDGKINLCRYSRADHDKKTAAKNIHAFLAYAKERLKPQGVKISVCLFGLTATDDTGMGIGQHIGALTQLADYVAPMMYPSHYNKGEMGIPNPNREPYKTIHRGLKGAITRLGENSYRLRPYLQDFSMGFRYKDEQVRAQITAAENLGVTSWMLWNPQNRYTWSALTPKKGTPQP